MLEDNGGNAMTAKAAAAARKRRGKQQQLWQGSGSGGSSYLTYSKRNYQLYSRWYFFVDFVLSNRVQKSEDQNEMPSNILVQ